MSTPTPQMPTSEAAVPSRILRVPANHRVVCRRAGAFGSGAATVAQAAPGGDGVPVPGVGS
jgi:hypothetical protein